MTVFEKPSPDNTQPALRLALARARDMRADVVLATNTGDSAFAALNIAREVSFAGRVVAVTHVDGFARPGENELHAAVRALLEKENVAVVTAAHALSGAERSLSHLFGGVYPTEIVAHALRMFSQGVKVCVEVSAMALDAGRIAHGAPIVALGGTGRGLDTACVLTPAYTARLMETRVHEVLCKPY